MIIPKLYKNVDSSNFVVTLNNHGPSKLIEDVRMKLIDAYKGEEGYKKISQHFQLSTVQNVIKTGESWETEKTFKIKLLVCCAASQSKIPK